MIARPVSVWPAEIGFEPLDDLETLTDILQVALTRLIQLCDETSQPAKAAAWRKALADYEKRPAEASQASPSSRR